MKDMLKPTKKQLVTYLRLLYPLWAIVGMISILVIPGEIIVDGNATATAQNIVDTETLFRLSIFGGLLVQLLQITVVLLLYKLFSSVDRGVSKLLLIVTLVGVPISMASYAPKLLAIDAAHGGEIFADFDAAQLQSLVMLLWNLGEMMINVATIFWGLWLLPIGYLANKSNYFPKFIGYALYIGGIGYFFSIVVKFILPQQEALFSLLEVMTFGEMIFIFWLIILGAKLPKNE